MLKEIQDGLIVQFKILPNSFQNEIIKTGEDIKIKITAQPVDGKANKALIEFLAKEFKIPKSSIEILKGHTGKDKKILFKCSDSAKVNFIKDKFS